VVFSPELLPLQEKGGVCEIRYHPKGKYNVLARRSLIVLPVGAALPSPNASPPLSPVSSPSSPRSQSPFNTTPQRGVALASLMLDPDGQPSATKAAGKSKGKGKSQDNVVPTAAPTPTATTRASLRTRSTIKK
jgi:hypothetical protein